MTLEEEKYLDAIKGLQRFYGQQYKFRDVTPYWDQLMALPLECLQEAVEELKGSGQNGLPKIETVISKVREYQARHYKDLGFDQAAEVLRVGGYYFDGILNREEYAAELKRIAGKYQQPAYLRMAEDLLSR